MKEIKKNEVSRMIKKKIIIGNSLNKKGQIREINEKVQVSIHDFSFLLY